MHLVYSKEEHSSREKNPFFKPRSLLTERFRTLTLEERTLERYEAYGSLQEIF